LRHGCNGKRAIYLCKIFI